MDIYGMLHAEPCVQVCQGKTLRKINHPRVYSLMRKKEGRRKKGIEERWEGGGETRKKRKWRKREEEEGGKGKRGEER